MIDMAICNDAEFWRRAAEQNAELAAQALQEVEQLKAELETEKRNHALMTAGMQMWQKSALDTQQEIRNLRVDVQNLKIELADREERIFILEQKLGIGDPVVG